MRASPRLRRCRRNCAAPFATRPRKTAPHNSAHQNPAIRPEHAFRMLRRIAGFPPERQPEPGATPVRIQAAVGSNYYNREQNGGELREGAEILGANALVGPKRVEISRSYATRSQ